MANFAPHSGTESNDQSAGNRPAGKRPIMLARLPRMGADAAAPPVTIPIPQPPLPAPPVAEIPQPEPMPQLDLRTDIQQQLRLHTAHPAEPARMHTPELEPQPETHRRRERRRSNSRAETSHARQNHEETAAPTGLGKQLFQLHSNLAPHAGLIVTLALIASAGLLYWLIVGPAHIPALNSPQYGQELGLEGYGVNSAQLPEFRQQTASTSGGDSWAEQQLQGPQQVQGEEQLVQPEVERPVGQGLQFPTTSNPNTLNFTQMGPTLPPAAEAPQALPEVARRSTAPANR